LIWGIGDQTIRSPPTIKNYISAGKSEWIKSNFGNVAIKRSCQELIAKLTITNPCVIGCIHGRLGKGRMEALRVHKIIPRAS
jgi:hypothetical protein